MCMYVCLCVHVCMYVYKCECVKMYAFMCMHPSLTNMHKNIHMCSVYLYSEGRKLDMYENPVA
jgi:hypothetical protein